MSIRSELQLNMTLEIHFVNRNIGIGGYHQHRYNSDYVLNHRTT